MNNKKWVYMFGDEHMSEFFETKEDAISEGLSVHGEDEWSSEKELNVGDNIIYHRVGAYSMTFGGPFIRYFPNVYVKDGNKNVFLVRNRIDVEEYYHIHTNL